jgi:GNAT superfamily N-acetyltransferase
MDVVYLVDCVEAIPQLAAWFRAEWPDEIGGDAESGFHRCTNTSEIPIGLVAVDGDRPIGTVRLLSTSVHSHSHLEPWIGGLYVEPRWRHRGVASRLIDAALETAGSIGVTRVYIGVAAARDFYERSGWAYLEDGDALGEKVMIFSKRV